MDSERLKQLEQAEQELRRRRERGKLAQRAFRKRQGKKTVTDGNNETQRLKAAIEAIARVARQDDRPELLQAIREAAESAGSEFDLQKSANDDTNSDTNSKSAAKRSSPLLDIVKPVTESQAASTGLTAITQESSLCSSGFTNWRSSNEKMTSLRARMNSERVRPRFDYGLWFNTDRFIRMDSPPLDIVPYLGPGMATFAGRIFWAAGEYLLNLCRRAEAYADTNPIAAREANEKIWGMVQHSPPLHNVRYIIALAEARREFRDRGYIEGNNPAGETDSAKLLQEHVLADYRSRGEDATLWLSPRAVENELRKRLSYKSYRSLEHALQLWDSKQAGPSLEVAKSLIHALARTFICFGDGPRWRADRVSTLLGGNIQTEPSQNESTNLVGP
ncbi:hypothetical protein F5Y13DRAFT_131527 [Hypoxylon sp. FL1857]|nr:hypothetical protein F5Y13DRAFT_131527 [Hypoxylon sp. FL1857]